MAGRKLPKNLDLAAGFFSETMAESTVPPSNPSSNVNHETSDQAHKKHPGGRPKKDGLKNSQFTVTLNPISYERMKAASDLLTGGNFSSLVYISVREYCKANKIDLEGIEIDPEIVKVYYDRQAKKK